MESLVAGLALLACPLGMGAMMWFMMRGMRQPSARAAENDELGALRAEQLRLEAEVGRLRDPEAAPADPRATRGR